MNGKSVKKLIVGLGFAPESFVVKGERAGLARFFIVTFREGAADGRATEVKAAIVAELKSRGYGGGCDIIGSQGVKLA